MLSRVADAIYWTARDLERALAVARLLEVSSAQALEGALANGAGQRHVWEPALAVAADPIHFHERHVRAEARSVGWYLSLSDVNPNGVAVCIGRARERVRSVRSKLPSELFEAVSTADRLVRAWTPQRFNREGVYAFCHAVHEGVARIDGVVDRSVRRDETWQLLRLGRHLERAAQTTRLLIAHDGAESPVGLGDWRALLRAAGSYETYLRVALPGGGTSAKAFLLLDLALPMSVTYCLGEVTDSLMELRVRQAGSGDLAPKGVAMGALRAAGAAAQPGADPGSLSRLAMRLDDLHAGFTAIFAPDLEQPDGAVYAQAVRQAQN